MICLLRCLGAVVSVFGCYAYQAVLRQVFVQIVRHLVAGGVSSYVAGHG